MSDSPVRSQDSVRPASGPGLRRILLNTISCYGRNFVEIATLLVLTPFILETVGKQAYGLWALVSAWVGLLALVDLGLGIAVVKFVADARGRGDRDGVRALVGTIFWTYAGLGTVLFLLATLSLLFFNQLFDIPEARRTSARAALFLLATRSALCLPLGAFQGVLVGFQKANIANVYRTVALMLYFGSVLVLLGRFPDIRVLAAINLGLGILSTGAMLAHARATLPEALSSVNSVAAGDHEIVVTVADPASGVSRNHRLPIRFLPDGPMNAHVARGVYRPEARPAMLVDSSLILDAVTDTGLDILKLLQELNEDDGLTILMITHDDSIASGADVCHRMQDGQLQIEAPALQVA